FKSCESIINFYREKEFLLKKAKKLFLFDYELLGNEKTGLQIIDELNIKENAILVTSHYEEEHIRNECKRLGVKLLPKNLAGFVPISVSVDRFPVSVKEKTKKTDSGQRTTDNDQYGDRLSVVVKEKTKNTDSGQRTADHDPIDAILIDDDYLVHTTWRLIAKQHGKTVKCYVDPEDFVNDSDDINKATPLYIDSNLGDGVKGEVLAKEFYEQGFTNIYLATGYPKDDFAKVPWIKDVVGKQPPFGNQ
ncbi:hypothetical protein KJ708_01535, partial [bacterium]|nr:hypothetical protein [bacterium]